MQTGRFSHQYKNMSPIRLAMLEHTGLTLQETLEIAEAFGF